MVTVMKGGEEVKISKRAGTYVTLRDLIDEVGRDATRFFLVSRSADTEFVFDIDLAKSQSEDNPVYYVQYAHARICSVLASSGAGRTPGVDERLLADADLAPLAGARELALLAAARRISRKCWRGRAASFAPHQIAFYLRELAGEFHSYYNAERILVADARVEAGAAGARRGRAAGAAKRSRADRRERSGKDVMVHRMSKDYKTRPRQRRKRKAAAGCCSACSSASCSALGVAAAIAIYFFKTPVPFLNKAKPPEKAATRRDQAWTKRPSPARPTTKPRFDFYRILPGQEEPVTEQQLKQAAKAAAKSGASSRTRYFLQAGAFQNPADADNLKAKLALLGLEASVEPTNLPDKGVWYRVRLGPYVEASMRSTGCARSLLQNGIDASLVKIKRYPPELTGSDRH